MNFDRLSQCLKKGEEALRIDLILEARQAFAEAIEVAPECALAYLGMGLCDFKQSSHAVAIRMLRRAYTLDSSLVIAVIFEVRAMTEMGDHDQARDRIATITQPSLLSPELANEFALACIGLARYSDAEAILRQALKKAPNTSSLQINLACVLERKNQVEEAIALIEHVAELDGFGTFLLAKLIRRRGDCLEALRLLEQLQLEKPADLTESLASDIDVQRGQILDELGRYEQAYAAFSQAKQRDRLVFARNHGNLRIGSWRGWLKDSSDADPPAPLEQSPTHRKLIFLVGFPRSGTTLLDQLIDSHPELEVLEEKPLIQRVEREIVARGWAASNLGAREVEVLRDCFWEEVVRHGSQKLRIARGIVDKSPFNLIRAQLIHRLFPSAKWVFAARHPLDVALSCFMQRFSFTDVTEGFWTLDSIADIYCACLTIWTAQSERLNLDQIVIRYEDVVAGGSQETRRLYDFIDLGIIPPNVLPSTHAKSRWIMTPSYHQVVQPISSRSVNRWRNYERWLATIEPRLSKWIRQFDYST